MHFILQKIISVMVLVGLISGCTQSFFSSGKSSESADEYSHGISNRALFELPELLTPPDVDRYVVKGSIRDYVKNKHLREVWVVDNYKKPYFIGKDKKLSVNSDTSFYIFDCKKPRYIKERVQFWTEKNGAGYQLHEILRNEWGEMKPHSIVYFLHHFACSVNTGK